MVKNCPACGNSVSVQAISCPNCGHPLKDPTSSPNPPPQKRSLAKPLLGCLFSIILFFVFIGMFGKYLGLESSKEDTPAAENKQSKGVSKEAFNQIQKGWTQQQVRALLGNPDSETESETPAGKMQLWHFQNNKFMGFGGAEAITIFFLNGKVDNKTWTKL